MKDFTRPIIGPAFAISILGAATIAAGSAAAGSRDKNATYPPMPTVNKNSRIPQKKPLTDRLAKAPKAAEGSGEAGGKTAAGEGPPRLGVERASPERQIPDGPTAATNGPAGANGPVATE